jgi:hypothetical protein
LLILLEIGQVALPRFRRWFASDDRGVQAAERCPRDAGRDRLNFWEFAVPGDGFVAESVGSYAHSPFCSC